MTDAPFVPMTDGVVRLRASSPDDVAVLVAGRDDESLRWLGPGVDDPHPTACVLVDDEVAGWVDFDPEEDWLAPGEVNVGYQVFPRYRGRGYASRAVQLLLHHLAVRTDRRTAVLSIDCENERSLALATRLDCEPAPGHNEQSIDFRRPVPPLTYSDGVVTLRPPRPDDLDADLAAKDDEEIRWMWLPGEREVWEAMTPSEQREHARRGLEARVEGFGTGPKWTFSVDAGGDPYVAYVDCDLANPHVPHGDANVSCSVHPAHRGRGYAARSARLVGRFRTTTPAPARSTSSSTPPTSRRCASHGRPVRPNASSGPMQRGGRWSVTSGRSERRDETRAFRESLPAPDPTPHDRTRET